MIHRYLGIFDSLDERLYVVYSRDEWDFEGLTSSGDLSKFLWRSCMITTSCKDNHHDFEVCNSSSLALRMIRFQSRGIFYTL